MNIFGILSWFAKSKRNCRNSFYRLNADTQANRKESEQGQSNNFHSSQVHGRSLQFAIIEVHLERREKSVLLHQIGQIQHLFYFTQSATPKRFSANNGIDMNFVMGKVHSIEWRTRNGKKEIFKHLMTELSLGCHIKYVHLNCFWPNKMNDTDMTVRENRISGHTKSFVIESVSDQQRLHLYFSCIYIFISLICYSASQLPSEEFTVFCSHISSWIRMKTEKSSKRLKVESVNQFYVLTFPFLHISTFYLLYRVRHNNYPTCLIHHYCFRLCFEGWTFFGGHIICRTRYIAIVVNDARVWRMLLNVKNVNEF